jgi:hypothetical protein
MFAEESPGGASSNALSKQLGFVSVPPKTITAMQIYINEKCEEDQKKGSKVFHMSMNYCFAASGLCCLCDS